ncbi:unnamed protein product [Orchesella dallaii]|uniref:RING-type domain-containing protein n=1 Tax=Orchesella dallaii TaxID=48710 RepID=A0ABP1RUH7_9HEXA
MTNEDIVTPTGCDHQHHRHCMQTWLEIRGAQWGPSLPICCPYCRQGDCRNLLKVLPPPPPVVHGPPPVALHLRCEVCGLVFRSRTSGKSRYSKSSVPRLRKIISRC